jgi:hypothetical protein
MDIPLDMSAKKNSVVIRVDPLLRDVIKEMQQQLEEKEDIDVSFIATTKILAQDIKVLNKNPSMIKRKRWQFDLF